MRRSCTIVALVILLLIALVLRGIWVDVIVLSSSSSIKTSSSSSRPQQDDWREKTTTLITKLWHSTIKRTIRITPDDSINVDGFHSNNNYTTTKSCVYHQRRGRWRCQECDDAFDKCHRLSPRGKCRPFGRADYPVTRLDDSTVAIIMTTNHSMPLLPMIPTRTLSYLRYRYEKQPLCTVATCFDLDRCRSSDGVLAVYLNSTAMSTNKRRRRRRDLDKSLELLEFAMRSINNNHNSITRRRSIRLERVDNHEQACLVIVMRGMYVSIEELKSSAAWNTNKNGKNRGQNHLLWQVNRLARIRSLAVA